MAVARQTGGTAGAAGDSRFFRAEALVKRGANAAATALAHGAVNASTGDAATAAWALALAADAANGGLAVSAAGEASKTINWVARVLSVEVVG